MKIVEEDKRSSLFFVSKIDDEGKTFYGIDTSMNMITWKSHHNMISPPNFATILQIFVIS
jgi:hypothetical protein